MGVRILTGAEADTTVTVEFAGHVAELNTRPLTAVACKGLLGSLMESVNMVNAPLIARERNISVTEIKRDHHDLYQTLLTLSATTDGQTTTVSASTGLPAQGSDVPRGL